MTTQHDHGGEEPDERGRLGEQEMSAETALMLGHRSSPRHRTGPTSSRTACSCGNSRMIFPLKMTPIRSDSASSSSRSAETSRTALPSAARLHDLAMDELRGPDVHAARGLGGHQEVRLGGELPRHHGLLLVAAGQRVRRRVLRRRSDVVLLDDLARRFADRARVHQLQPRGERRLVVAAEGEVRGDGEGEEKAVLQAVLRDVGDALLPPSAARSRACVDALQEDLPGFDVDALRDGVHELALPVAFHARDAVDLACPDREGNPVHRGKARGGSGPSDRALPGRSARPA